MLCFVHLIRRMSVCGRVPGMNVRSVTNDVAFIMFYVRWGVHGGDYSKTAVSVVNFVMWVSLNHYAEEDVTTYQESISSDLTNMLERSRITLQLTWRRCDNVPGTCCKSLEEHVTTYEEHLASHLNKSLQRIRNVLQVTDK